MAKPGIGRIVHYRFIEAEGGMERPAIIVRTWGEEEDSSVQIQVFTDADENGHHNDGQMLNKTSSLVWKTSVTQGSEPGQFHFHEDCPPFR